MASLFENIEVDPAAVLESQRSLQAVTWLRRQGYLGVQSLAGGVGHWADEVDSDMPRY